MTGGSDLAKLKILLNSWEVDNMLPYSPIRKILIAQMPIKHTIHFQKTYSNIIFIIHFYIFIVCEIQMQISN